MRGELLEAEHLARYWWVAALASGKRVLDAGCGTGYGSEILAQAGAAEVIGVDVDVELIERTREATSGTVSLVAADARNLPFENSSFDLVVCFEVIEHVDDPGAILDELRRVVREDGLVAVSSPNRDVYPSGNPHHKHEFRPDELAGELTSRFEQVRLIRQHDWLASAILEDDEFSADGGDGFEALARTAVARAGGEELYSLALASPSRLPRLTPQIVLTDTVDVKWWGERLRALEETTATMERDAAQAKRGLEELQQEKAAIGDRVLEVEQELADEHQRLALRESMIADLRREAEELAGTVSFMRATRVWRVGTRYWRIRDRLLGRARRRG